MTDQDLALNNGDLMIFKETNEPAFLTEGMMPSLWGVWRHVEGGAIKPLQVDESFMSHLYRAPEAADTPAIQAFLGQLALTPAFPDGSYYLIEAARAKYS